MFGNQNAPADKEMQEKGYRDYYLKADISLAKLISVLFAVPIVGFIFNDYAFFGFSDSFYGVVSLRLVLLLVLGVEFMYLGKVTDYHSYDKTIFTATLALIIGGGIINATRPSNFVVTCLISIVSVFVLYLFLPLKFRYQLFLASFLSIGELLIVFLLSTNLQSSVVYALIFTMFVANLIGAFGSWQTQSHRRRIYREFMQRKALQDELEKHANHLSDLVSERTRDLVEAQSRLMQSERLATIGEMAGMVGHDLRNPLAAIKNASYYLRKNKSADIGDVGNEMLTAIDRSVEHANSIVADLLDFSREIHLNLEEYSPKALIGYALLSLKIPSDIKLTQNVADQPTIWVDSNKIERVFTNIIKNALEAMPNGGNLEISSRQNGENVEFMFADSGIGMSEDVAAKIFKPLFTTKAQGMGFGLAICKRMIEAHNGRISVESAPNKGTKFTISLPIKQKTPD